MAYKKTGFEFWNDILESPRFVAAPMVDMSELAFRMLCRNHGAQLCYSPMFHSQQFVSDYLYRLDSFSTCTEDRPLIVQFCANDPDIFVKAATIVSDKCDAVDLNLGCPQAIARKGNYGAFLQDDWNLIHSIIKKAANELPIPVTCKMRILPGPLKKSVEYAKMLEHAGASIITVHGRTREQKGHATGLASWEVIKEVKASVGIPVIANGNILSFKNINECLKYTGVDAVMSAEALLHNPALFSGKNPSVFSIIEEYLSLARIYDTPIKNVRCHLYKILYLCLYENEFISQELENASSLSDFRIICQDLENMFLKPKIDKDLIDTLEYFDLSSDESCNLFETDAFNSDENINSDVNNSIDLSHHIPTETVVDASNYQLKMGTNALEKLSYNDLLNINCMSPIEKAFKEKSFEHLPVWLCHSRPRIGDNEKSKGCYRRYFTSLQGNNDEEQYVSKKKLRRVRHHEKVLAGKKEKRKVKKMRRKLKIAEMKQNQPEKVKDDAKERLTKKQQKMLIRDRLLKAQGVAPKVCINLGFAAIMVEKELGQLAGQLRRLYGSNRHSETPLDLYFCNFDSSDELFQICQAKNDGFSSYVVHFCPEEPEDLFELDDLIYLSPDSENVLETLDTNKVYVIGGIVDGTVKKDLSLNHAKALNIKTARLPISEYLVKCSSNPGTTVLTVNQVFDILLKYYESKDWVEALSVNFPSRKGYCAPSKVEANTKNIDTETLSVGISSNLNNISDVIK